jgi:hypothetical protein
MSSTLFQLFRGGQFYWWRKPEYPEKTNDLSQVTRHEITEIVLKTFIIVHITHFRVYLCQKQNRHLLFRYCAIIINDNICNLYFWLIKQNFQMNCLPFRSTGVRVTRSLVLYVCFVDRCLSFCAFSFGHCVVCYSSIYWSWLPLWDVLQTERILKQ